MAEDKDFRVFLQNKKIPFVVNASGMSITAVGTEFNVRNYSDEDEVCATRKEDELYIPQYSRPL